MTPEEKSTQGQEDDIIEVTGVKDIKRESKFFTHRRMK